MRQKASTKLLRKEYEKLIESIEPGFIFANDGEWDPFLEGDIRRANLIYPFRNAEELNELLDFAEWFSIELKWSEFLPEEFANLYLKRKEEKYALIYDKAFGGGEENHDAYSQRKPPSNEQEEYELRLAIGYTLARSKKKYAVTVAHSMSYLRQLVRKWKKRGMLG